MPNKPEQNPVVDEQDYEPVKDKYEEAGDAFEDKLDRQKGDGANKPAPSHQGKPKSVRSS